MQMIAHLVDHLFGVAHCVCSGSGTVHHVHSVRDDEYCGWLRHRFHSGAASA